MGFAILEKMAEVEGLRKVTIVNIKEKRKIAITRQKRVCYDFCSIIHL